MFNFDEFVNKPCIEIFGREVSYIPASSDFEAFAIRGDFHRDYQGVKNSSTEVEISSSEIVIFLRDIDMSTSYPKAKQGDFIEIDDLRYQIIDIQQHIPGSKKLILHESPANSD
jgi:hypothetical protein